MLALLERLAQRLGTQHARETVLLLIAMLSVLGTLTAWGLLAWTLTRPTPMHYTAAQGPGLALPGVIPDAYALDFAERVLETRYTFTSLATFDKQMQTLRDWVHPHYTQDFDLEVESDRKLIKQALLGSTVTVLARTVTKRTSGGMIVHLEARRVVSVGDRLNPEQVLTADVVLVPLDRHSGKLVIWQMPTTPPLSPRPTT